MSTTAGALDPTFGGGYGYSTVPPSLLPGSSPPIGQYAQVSVVAVQPDGKIVVAGTVAVILSKSPFESTLNEITRFNADGSIDTTFGQDGEVILPIIGGGVGPGGVFTSLVIQPDGKVVEGGYGEDSSGHASYLAVRLNADGSVDTTFGSNGVAEYPSTVPVSGRLTAVGSELLQPDGKIILAGSSNGASTGQQDFAAVRLNADGSIDTSFGQGGTALVPVTVGGFTSATLSGAVLQPDGKILLAGDVVTGQTTIAPPAVTQSTTDVAVVRLNADGSVDTTYGGGAAGPGTVLLPASLGNPKILGNNAVTGVALLPNGDLLLSGSDSYPSLPTTSSFNTLYRLDTTGNLDPTFGTAGLAMPILSGKIALQSDGKITVAGSKFVAPQFRPAVARLNPDGTPDTTFGDPGTPGLAQAALNFAQIPVTLAIQPSDGKILLAGTGTTTSINGPVKGFAVGRLLPAASTGPAAKTTPLPPADLDGSGRTNIAIYDPNYASFAYRPSGAVNSTGNADQIVQFGITGAGQTIPAPGNYQGFGQDNIAAYLSASGIYAIRPLNGGPDQLTPFGIPGIGQSIPVPGDYEGAGVDDMAVYMPSIATFGIRPSTGGPDKLIPFGIAGAGQSIPAPADYFGTGQTDIAAYLAAYGAFAIRPPGGGPDQIIPFGVPGIGKSIPVPGDYDGSGHTELAVYIPSLGVFAYRPFNGGPDVIVPFGAVNDGSYAVPGDYDGSGRTNIAVYDPNYGTFAYRPANGSADVIVAFGTAKDGTIPVATPEGALPSFLPTPTATTKATVAVAAVPPGSVASTATLTKSAATPAGPSLAARRVALSPVAQSAPERTSTLG